MASDYTLDPPAAGRSIAALLLYPLAHGAVEIYANTLSILWPLLATRFDLAYGAVGLLGMIFRGMMTLPQLGFASLIDRYGGRRMAIWGLVWMAVGMSLVGIAPSVGVLAVLLALAPLGSAAFHPAATALMTRTAARRRGMAVALLMVGGSLGLSVGPLLAAWLCERWGMGATPLLIPLGLLVALAMVRFIPVESGAKVVRAASGDGRGAIPPAIFLLMVAVVVQAWVETNLTSYLPLLLTERGASLGLASQVLFAMSAAACVGIFVGGALSDRIPRWRVMVLAHVLTVPCYAGALLLPGQGVLWATAGVGFVSALSHPTGVALAQEMMPQRLSLASALAMGVSWVIGSLGAALTGVLADYLGMQRALLLNTGLPLLGMVCMLIVWRLGKRQTLAAPTGSTP